MYLPQIFIFIYETYIIGAIQPAFNLQKKKKGAGKLIGSCSYTGMTVKF